MSGDNACGVALIGWEEYNNGKDIRDGKTIAAQIRAELKTRVEALRAGGTVPCLAVLLAGDDPASKIYVRNKKRACAEIGIDRGNCSFRKA